MNSSSSGSQTDTTQFQASRVGKGRKLLVVDDSVVILKTLSMKLTAEGYVVKTAMDGATAVGIVRLQKPDLILLDLSFPPDTNLGGVSWDGFQVMDWLNRMGEAKGIPILIITGGDPEKYKDRALKAGAKHFFHKPIDNAELLSVIEQVLEGGSPEAN